MLLVLLACVAVASSCSGVIIVVVVIVSSKTALVAPFFFAIMWCGVSNRQVGAKLLVESAFGMDEHNNNNKEYAHRTK